MYGNKSKKPARIWAFKVKGILEGEQSVSDQIHLAHVYKNKLVEIERGRREVVGELLHRRDKGLAKAEEKAAAVAAAAKQLEDEVKARSQQARKRSVSTAEEKARLKELKAARKDAYAKLKERRQALFENEKIKAELAVIDRADSKSRKAARKEIIKQGLFWGSYLLAEQSLKGIRSGAPPDWRHWHPEGAVAVQFQGGLLWSDAMLGKDNRLRIERVSPDDRQTHSANGKYLTEPDPSSKRSQHYHQVVVWLRIGSNDDPRKTPIWAKVHAALHREPPPDTEIKWVYLHRGQTGRSIEWQLQFVLARDEWPRDRAASGTVGIKVGFRSVDEGLQIAHTVDDDGESRDLILPREWIDKLRHAESLRAIRDRNYNEIRKVFIDWLKGKSIDVLPEPENEDDPAPELPTVKGVRSGLPAWFFDKTAEPYADVRYLMRWKSPDRLARLVWYWTAGKDRKGNRFAADRAIFPAMEAWRKQDRHLHEWQDHERRKVLRRRDELYCRFAVNLARDYHTTGIADINWAVAKRKPGPVDPAKEAARFNAKTGAPGRFCELLREKFSKAEVVEVPATHVVNVCHDCGTKNKIADLDRRCTCRGCGAEWDVDHNTALNLLRSATEV